MKLRGLLRISVLISLLGATALIYAQEREEAKPAQEEARPETRRDEAKPSRQEEAKPPKQDEVKSRNEGKPGHEEGTKPPKHETEAEQPAQHEHHAEQHAGGQRGGHIPDDKFRAQFGRQHTFVVSRPTIVEGQPRFQYSGYWFTIVDPWPGDWAYTDDVYIDFIDGEYFLFDLVHPGVRIAVFVVM